MKTARNLRLPFERGILTAFVLLISVSSVFADAVFLEKRTGGGIADSEGKLYISSDKLQIKRRLTGQGAAQNARVENQAGGMAAQMAAQMCKREDYRQRRAQELQQKIQTEKATLGVMDEHGSNRRNKRDNNSGSRLRVEQEQAQLAKMQSGEQGCLEVDGVSQESLDARKEHVQAKGSEESMDVETVRFDQGTILRWKPHDMTYSESKLSSEHSQRLSRYKKQLKETQNLEAVLKDSGKTETVNGKSCKVYEGGLLGKGASYNVKDSLCIAEISKDVAAEYWQAAKRYASEVGPDSGIGEALLASRADYMDKLATLPGIPLRRTISVETPGADMSAMMANANGANAAQMQQMMAMMQKYAKASPMQSQGQTIELTIASQDSIDPNTFELPKGLKKK